MNPIVHSYPRHPHPLPIAAVGEAPGYEEACRGIPLVGPTGKEHTKLLRHNRIDPRLVFKGNVMREYKDGNPDPTPDDLARWAPLLESELSVVQPKLILALGRFAAEWFLGPIPLAYPMRSVNAVPHEGGCFDPGVAHRARGAVVVPIIHPAAGLRDGKQRVLVAYGYERAGEVWRDVAAGRPVDVRRGPFDWRARDGEYLWVSNTPRAGGDHISPAAALRECVRASHLGLDTEGSAAHPWSLQISPREGLSFVALAGTPECAELVEGLNHSCCRMDEDAPLVVIHNALHDIEVAEREDEEDEHVEEYDADGEVDIVGASTALGLRLNSARVVDTMYMLYTLRREPLGLKPATWRRLNLAMKAYMQVIGRAGIRSQVEYLARVAAGAWDEPARAVYRSNLGRPESWQPTPLHKRAAAILKRIEKGEEVDISPLWSKRDSERYRRQMLLRLRQEVESALGPLPEPTLADVDPADALWYAGGDPDLGLRLYHAVLPALESMDLVRTNELGRGVLPAAAEVQMSGMPVDRKYFVSFEEELTSTCEAIQDELAALLPPKEASEEKGYATEKNAERWFPGSPLLFGSFYDGEPFHLPDDEEKGRRERYLLPLPPTAKHPFRFSHHWTEAAPYFNPNSAPDTLRLVEHLGLTPLKTSRKTGRPSTAKDSIGHLQYGDAPENHAIARLFEWRTTNKVRQFADDVLESTDVDDLAPRMYHPVSMTRTESRRLTQGRLMTIPVRSELGLGVREGYVAPPGRVLAAADFARVEPGIAAHLSGDPRMLAVCYDPEGDIYKETASGVWKIPVSAVTKEQRDISKPLYLAVALYGMGAQGLQADLRQRKGTDGRPINLSLAECEEYIRGLYAHFSRFTQYGEEEVAKAARLGYVREPESGMYRFLPALYLSDTSDWRGRKDYAEARRHVVNHLVQTLAQLLIQNAMTWLHGELRRRRAAELLTRTQILLVLQLHDELVLECDDDDRTVESARALLVEALEEHHGLVSTVPITCDVNVGRNWRELKG